MTKKAVIWAFLFFVIVATIILVGQAPQKVRDEKQPLLINATPAVAVKPNSKPVASQRMATNNIETDQAKVEMELTRIPYHEVGEVVTLPDGKKSLNINGKQVMKAFDFVFRDRHPTGLVLIGARTEAGKSLDRFDYATDVVNGKALAASDSLWILTKEGTLQRITPENWSVQSARFSEDGERLAYAVIERDTNGFKSKQSLHVLDRNTGTSKVVSSGPNTAETLMPLRWESNRILRVFSASEHGGGMKLQNIVID